MKYPLRNIRNNLHYCLTISIAQYYRSVYGMDIGENTRIARSARLDRTNPKGIHIGSDTAVSFEVSILTHDFVHGKYVDTYIGERCFIGGRSTILPGVRIGDECIIGAGSVVMSGVPSNTIAVGNPAKLIRSGIRTSEYNRLNDDSLSE